ncbi:MAG: hypothetical protein JO107_01175 [Hyphomicrobiales bacterium]|nr:hypothetical protein [Hyphomicrobiales bacterium]MBV8661689.1 hypothetical protein [Hyphomicrobiales bacterium]
MPVGLAEGLDYKTLFDAGIALTQKSAADTWTDYNLHDPGVTILEQLCYALTDLAYRAGWPIEDLLAEPPKSEPIGEPFKDQRLREKETALFNGPDIFASAPVTEHDFRSLLFAQVENLQNAWLRRAPGTRRIQGLYAIDVQPYEWSEEALNQTRSDSRNTYLAARPLCEDVDAISILQPFPIKIDAEIEINNTDTANDIAANIFAALQTDLLPAPTYTSISIRREEGYSYDEIFEGPAVDVLVVNASPDRRPQQLAVAQFTRIAGGAAGVDSIRRLELEFQLDGRQERTTSVAPWGPDRVPTIDVAATLNAPGDFQLTRANKAQKLEPGRVRSNIEHRKYMAHEDVFATMRAIGSDPYNRAPSGVFRSPATYASIRDQFPRIYGLGRYGAPHRLLSPDGRSGRDAKIAQLGTYLSIFEQVMANHLAQLANAPTLFSLREKASEATYFWQKLESGAPRAAGRGVLGDVTPRDYPRSLAALVERQDAKLDRRARLLDHLLARFNEAFDDDDWTAAQEAVRRSSADAHADTRARNIAKAEFLSDYVFVGGYRGAGCNYALPLPGPQDMAACEPQFGRAVSGLERRLRLLTGVSELFIVEHILLRNRADAADADFADFYSLRLSAVAPRSETADSSAMEAFIEGVIEENCPAHIEYDCLFLNALPMTDFTRLHDAWRRAYAKAFADPPAATMDELDQRSRDLRTFLMQRLAAETL